MNGGSGGWVTGQSGIAALTEVDAFESLLVASATTEEPIELHAVRSRRMQVNRQGRAWIFMGFSPSHVPLPIEYIQ